jgi:hypothetical protein
MFEPSATKAIECGRCNPVIDRLAAAVAVETQKRGGKVRFLAVVHLVKGCCETSEKAFRNLSE